MKLSYEVDVASRVGGSDSLGRLASWLRLSQAVGACLNGSPRLIRALEIHQHEIGVLDYYQVSDWPLFSRYHLLATSLRLADLHRHSPTTICL